MELNEWLMVLHNSIMDPHTLGMEQHNSYIMNLNQSNYGVHRYSASPMNKYGAAHLVSWSSMIMCYGPPLAIYGDFYN